MKFLFEKVVLKTGEDSFQNMIEKPFLPNVNYEKRFE